MIVSLRKLPRTDKFCHDCSLPIIKPAQCDIRITIRLHHRNIYAVPPLAVGETTLPGSLSRNPDEEMKHTEMRSQLAALIAFLQSAGFTSAAAFALGVAEFFAHGFGHRLHFLDQVRVLGRDVFALADVFPEIE